MNQPKLIALALAGFAVAAGGVWLATRSEHEPWESRTLEKRVEEARAAGVPLAFEDLGLPLTIPKDENAAPELEAAGKMLLDGKVLLDAAQRVDRADRKHNARGALLAVASLAPALEKANQALEKPGYRPSGADFEYPPFTDLTTLQAARTLMNAFGLRARVRSRAGDLAGAETDLVSLNKVGALLRQSPHAAKLKASLTSSLSHRLGLEILADEHERGREVTTLATRLAATTFISDWDEALRHEAFINIQTVRNFDRLPVDQTGYVDQVWPLSKRPTVPARTTELPQNPRTRAQLGHVLGGWTAIKSIGKGAQLTHKATINEFDQLAAYLTRLGTPEAKFAADIFASHASAGRHDLAQSSVQDQLLAYAAVLDFKLRTNRFPQSLVEVGIASLDPVDRKPLRYKTTAKGFRIWSIGKNGVDDGGEGKDLVAEYPRFKYP